MYVTKEAIEVVRRSNDLIEIVRSRGIALVPRGRDFVGQCPFHQDDTLSLVIHPHEQRWTCEGACASGAGSRGGDVVAFVAKRDGVGLPEALRRLGYQEPIPPGQGGARAPGDDGRLLSRVTDHYHRSFRESPAAQDYLRSRGLTSPEMLDSFRVGYVDGSLQSMLTSVTGRQLRALGIITPHGREVLIGHVVFPVTSPDQGTIGLIGRDVTSGVERYVGVPGGAIFHWQAMKGSAEVILTASIFDALTLYQAGIRNVIALTATTKLAADQMGLFARFRVRRVLACLGHRAPLADLIGALAAALHRLGIDTVDLDPPGGAGPNAVVLALGAEKSTQMFRDWFGARRRSTEHAEPKPSGEGFREVPSQLRGTRVSEGEAPRPQPLISTGVPTVAKPVVSGAEGGGFVIRFPTRSYRVRGLRGDNLHQLRVNVRVDGNERMYVETLDLYGHRSRSGWLREAARELGVPEEDLIPELHRLIETLEGLRLTLRKRKEEEAKVEMPDQEREAALRALRNPSLVENILKDFEQIGFVGERGPLTVGYLAAVSRFLDEPLGIFVTSRSGAGKTSLQEAVCDLVPPEAVVRYTRITEQALFYKGEESLVHKVLAVDEERGATEATYSLRILQSAQQLTIGATRTDPHSGKLVTQEYRVRGPVAIFLTTASPNVLDPETRSRFVQVSIDESPEQTRRILERQRALDTLDGLVQRHEAGAIRRKHHNMQRLLRPLAVANPFAPVLTYPGDRLQMRREQKKYLTLIKAIALLHQHQRDVKRQQVGDKVVEYIEVKPQDITLANRLAREVLSHSLDDLAPHTRDLLRHIVRMAAAGSQCFTREDVRRQTGWSYWSVREHLAHLVKMEYAVVKSGGNGKRMTYRLLFDGDPDEERLVLAGLVEVEGRASAGDTLRTGDRKAEVQPPQLPGDGNAGPCGATRKRHRDRDLR